MWTSPREITRGVEAEALEAVKRIYDPRMGQPRATSRLSQGGNWLEADLFWDPVISTQLLGYGIYRGTNSTGALPSLDFYRDVYATFYADLDTNLVQGPTYYYEITALNTEYPDTGNSESAHSNRYGVTAIGDLELLSVQQGPLTFRWVAATGAETYSVFLFDEYPAIGSATFWQSAFTANTSIQYTGPVLIPGHTYYYVVLGVANGNDSRTLSEVGSFVAN
jgi:hypothetical protein